MMVPMERCASRIGCSDPSLKEQKFFAQARVDECGAVCWPNDADLAPDALYKKLKSHLRGNI
ncbi:DUF2442 domain-containing protein [Photorhabdus sp. P32]|uniref:DUF2442 domain-containing protein n=1 Tax=Photorhabdus sp. P32 TaxID=3117549 RepID=UPI00311ABA4D